MGYSCWGALTHNMSVPRVVAWWHLKWRGNNPSKDSRCSAAFSQVSLDLSSLQDQVLNLTPSKHWMDCLDLECCTELMSHEVLGLNPLLALQRGLGSLVPPQHTALPFLKPHAKTFCQIRTSLAAWPICTYSKWERNQGKDLWFRKWQCQIKRGQITDCVCSGSFNKLKVGAGGRIVNEACMIVEGGGKSG